MCGDLLIYKSRIYNVSSFNPSADEFFHLIQQCNSDAKILYKMNTVRQKIVDSWPCNIDDSLAQQEWGWYPDYTLERTINEYLQS